ncbi:GNAT family N-acetyltransferase [Roseateles asaccharophilus]|uniref:Aspartate aminotransferase-like enzyme/GNAT superfamily N-acetyltransferase n=1 Tax=Roseateles asaccharophilus TaxID=582607 RepID=A0ABU2A7L1_9BURK|nr:GNAT family N-acetyltransferase [Roseateles asaccharophilus]MDR7333182.1 aspartate aminotransferase-like enzyme/GNAT superfamily N-acetyltransferase [Roseateles asaccharophilus]
MTLVYKIATTAAEFEAIHQLNYRTFVEEIPQHPPNPQRRLVDRFHDENTYAIALEGEQLVGMIAGRARRPFSLDAKLAGLDALLPAHQHAMEVRLLAVAPDWRKASVFAKLAGVLGREFRDQGCDLALISGTTRELKLYAHLGFQPFGPRVGSGDAVYQPMWLRLPDYAERVAHLELSAGDEAASFLPGPVPLSAAVRAAWCAAPVSHRSSEHLRRVGRVRERLCALTGCADALLLPGGGTLANDAVAAQIARRGGAGLVITSGEFGERLADHARRWRLPHRTLALGWGEALAAQRLRAVLAEQRPAWVWATACETSTGARHDIDLLRDACAEVGAALCLDAVSALGLQPLDVRGVWLASSVSGKALGSYPGLALVLHDGHLAPAGTLPAALDLAGIAAAGGVASTQSSNAVAALEAALNLDWPAHWQATQAADAQLRDAFAALGLPALVSAPHAQPGVITLALPAGISSERLGNRLARVGCRIAWQSAYLRERNWVQVCLMGAWRPAAVEVLPALLRRYAGAME